MIAGPASRGVVVADALTMARLRGNHRASAVDLPSMGWGALKLAHARTGLDRTLLLSEAFLYLRAAIEVGRGHV